MGVETKRRVVRIEQSVWTQESETTGNKESRPARKAEGQSVGSLVDWRGGKMPRWTRSIVVSAVCARLGSAKDVERKLVHGCWS